MSRNARRLSISEVTALEVLEGQVLPIVWAGRPTALNPNHIRVRGRMVRPNENPDGAVEDMGRSHHRASPLDPPIQAYPWRP